VQGWALFAEIVFNYAHAPEWKKSNKTCKKASSTLYNDHYVKLTMSYPQKKYYSGITV